MEQAAVTLLSLRLFRSLPQTSFLPLTSYDGLFLLLLVLAQAFFGKTKINKKLNDVSRVNIHTHTHTLKAQRTHTNNNTLSTFKMSAVRPLLA